MYFVGIALLLSQIVCCNCMISLTATPLINVFTSHPGYDGHVRYPDGNYTQDWYLTTNWINHTIKIHFATCFIENSKGVCLFDYLYVYDGANSSSPELLKTCCGDIHSASLESSTGEMYILFETDNTVGDTGFEIEYWSNGITTTTTTTTVAPTTEINTDTTTMQISTAGKTTTMQISSVDNSRYIIIACVVTGLLVIIVAVLIVVMVMKKNKAATYPRPFLVDDGKPIQPDSRNTKFKNGQKKMAFPAPPPTPPLHTIMPQTETNLFDLELPEKGRANRLPPLYSSIATSNTN
ncbi:scavenger receptor cysteine-rich domain-containing protein DMBT1-like isoform X2 [Mytilus edulis]|uniref:scavenger receptor cysteine-rich domain-containing protein DMBT1-like isoform X2 n=1 Tax=Mytilus edulis TaxID=6550 RepID=UPI0039EF4A41